MLCSHAAPTVSLAWDPSPDADVVNYRLHWGPASASYTNHADLGNVTNTVFTQLAPGGHYWFVVTALNAGGAESDPSNEIDYQVPVTPPKKLRILSTLETSTNLTTWTPLTTVDQLVSVDPATSQFYRTRLAIEPPKP